jgi:hypothetical protein
MLTGIPTLGSAAGKRRPSNRLRPENGSASEAIRSRRLPAQSVASRFGGIRRAAWLLEG